MDPFDSYRCGGYRLLGRWKGSNARHEYGLEFMRLTGQTHCVYCNQDLANDFNLWLTLTLDHAVPKSLFRELNIGAQWGWDYSNAVLACGPCNGFCNRYRPSFAADSPKTHEAFFKLRDQIFEERKKQIALRRAEEKNDFEGKPWERHPTEGHRGRW